MTRHPLSTSQLESLIRPHLEQLRQAQGNLSRNVRYLLGELGLSGSACSLSEDGRFLLVEDGTPPKVDNDNHAAAADPAAVDGQPGPGLPLEAPGRPPTESDG